MSGRGRRRDDSDRLVTLELEQKLSDMRANGSESRVAGSIPAWDVLLLRLETELENLSMKVEMRLSSISYYYLMTRGGRPVILDHRSGRARDGAMVTKRFV